MRGARTGSGIFRYANGDKYTGQFQNGDKHGQGTFVWKSGDSYIGQWKQDKQDASRKVCISECRRAGNVCRK